MEHKVGFFEYIFTDKDKHVPKKAQNFSSKFDSYVNEKEEEDDVFDVLFDNVQKESEKDLFQDLFSDNLEKENNEDISEETSNNIDFEETNVEDDKDQRLLNMIESSKDIDTKDFFEELKKKKDMEEDSLMSLQDLADSLVFEEEPEEDIEDISHENISLENIDKDIEDNFGDFDILEIKETKDKEIKEEDKDNDTNFDIPMI